MRYDDTRPRILDLFVSQHPSVPHIYPIQHPSAQRSPHNEICPTPRKPTANAANSAANAHPHQRRQCAQKRDALQARRPAPPARRLAHARRAGPPANDEEAHEGSMRSSGERSAQRAATEATLLPARAGIPGPLGGHAAPRGGRENRAGLATAVVPGCGLIAHPPATFLANPPCVSCSPLGYHNAPSEVPRRPFQRWVPPRNRQVAAHTDPAPDNSCPGPTPNNILAPCAATGLDPGEEPALQGAVPSTPLPATRPDWVRDNRPLNMPESYDKHAPQPSRHARQEPPWTWAQHRAWAIRCWDRKWRSRPIHQLEYQRESRSQCSLL